MHTAAHINKTGFSRMKVGLAIDVCSILTANQLRLRRHGGWAPKAGAIGKQAKRLVHVRP